MRRLALTPDGIFVSRRGFDALNDRFARLVDPRYRMMEQHAQGEVTSIFQDGGKGWSRHRAVFHFPVLPYRPIHHYAMTWNREPADTARYPNYLWSATTIGSAVPGGGAMIERDHLWVESSVHTNTRAPGLFRLRVTIMKADSGL